MEATLEMYALNTGSLLHSTLKENFVH